MDLVSGPEACEGMFFMDRIGYGLMILLCVGLMALSFSGCGKPTGEARAQNEQKQTGRDQADNLSARVAKVSIVEVRPTPLRDVLILPGATKPWQDITLPADLDGQVEWIGPREGDTVKKGEMVAKIDVSVLKAQLDNSRAAFKLADELYRRRKRLFDRKIISQEELDQARTERVVKQGTFRQAQVQYEKGLVYAQIDATVNQLYVDEGEYVGRGAPVADLVNVDKIEIDVNVPELDVRYLKPGQPVMFRVDAIPNQDFHGIIEFVALKADPATKTFNVKVLADNSVGHIRPGMITRVAFLRQVIPDALVAPLFALLDKGGERVLFVEQDGIAHARTVSVGVISGDQIQITQGLEAGDHLIVSGQNDVEEGTRVQVQ